MATVRTNDGEQRITCDIPKCRRQRHDRGQDDGRFLAALSWHDGMLCLTVVCAECGGTHTLTVQPSHEFALTTT